MSSLRELYHTHAVDPPGQVGASSRLAPLHHPDTTATGPAMTLPRLSAVAMSSLASDCLRLPEVNTRKEPPVPLSAAVVHGVGRGCLGSSGSSSSSGSSHGCPGGPAHYGGTGYPVGPGRTYVPGYPFGHVIVSSSRPGTAVGLTQDEPGLDRSGRSGRGPISTSFPCTPTVASHTPASIAAHTAAAQRSVAVSGQPKFVVMTGPPLDTQRRVGRLSTQRAPQPSSRKTVTAYKKQAATAKAEMLANVSYTIDRADGSSMTFIPRSASETFGITPAALEAAGGVPAGSFGLLATSGPRGLSFGSGLSGLPSGMSFELSSGMSSRLLSSGPGSGPGLPAWSGLPGGGVPRRTGLLPIPEMPSTAQAPAIPAISITAPASPPVIAPGQGKLLPPPPDIRRQLPVSADESVELPPIRSGQTTSTARLVTMEPTNLLGPAKTLGPTKHMKRPSHMVFPLTVENARARAHRHRRHRRHHTPEYVSLDRSGSVNLMSVPAAAAGPVGGVGAAGAAGAVEAPKQFLLPDHEMRAKTALGRRPFGFQTEQFKRQSRSKHREERQRQREERRRYRLVLQAEQRQAKQLEAALGAVRSASHPAPAPAGVMPSTVVLPEAPVAQLASPHESSQFLQVPQVRSSRSRQPPAAPRPEQRVLADSQDLVQQVIPPPPERSLSERLLAHLPTPIGPPRSALPPHVLGGPVPLEAMPQVRIVRVGNAQTPALLPRSHIPAFLLLPRLGSDEGCRLAINPEGRYTLFSAGEITKMEGLLGLSSATASAELAAVLPGGAVEGCGDATWTRQGVRELSRVMAFGPHEFDEEITGRSIALSLCYLVAEKSGSGHSLNLRELASTIAAPASSGPNGGLPEALPMLMGWRVSLALPTNAAATPTTGLVPEGSTLPGGLGVEVPCLTILMGAAWSNWTISACPLRSTAAACLAASDLYACDHLQHGHPDNRIPAPGRMRIVRRGTARHRHAGGSTPVHLCVVMTRVSTGMQDNLIVEERVFFVGKAWGKSVVPVYSTAYFLEA